MSEPLWLPDAAALRAWLAEHHATAAELVLICYRRGTGVSSPTWSEIVDEVLCVGWIDGVRKGIDAERFTIRLTPRRRGSTWSAINVRKVEELRAAGRMQPAGEAAFAERREDRTAIYSFEQATPPALSAEQDAAFRAHPEAYAWFAAAPPSYRRPAIWWVISAKRPETSERRLAQLIADSAAGVRVKHLRRP
jgi:uncharacterized protein YdeI (YjbR/CyaY-like superfamily)